jgi:hypothetical protein
MTNFEEMTKKDLVALASKQEEILTNLRTNKKSIVQYIDNQFVIQELTLHQIKVISIPVIICE